MGLNSPIELKMTEAGLAAKENADSIIFTRFLAGSTGDANSTSVTSIKQVIPINNYVKRIAGQEYIQDGVTQVANESFLSINGFANSLDAENEYVLNEIALMAKLNENGEEFCFAYDWSNSYKYRIRTDLSQPITVQYKIILTRVPQLIINTSETGVTFSDLYAHTEKTVTQTPVHGLKCIDGVLTVNNRALHKSTVGLGNVDNTSDLDKPVSTAVQTELNGLSDRIDGLATSDTTISDQVQDLAFDFAEHKNDETNPHNVTAAQVGAAAISHTHVEADITDLGDYASSNHTHTESDITDLGNYATNTDLNSYGVSSLSFDDSTSVLTITMKDNSTKTATITGTGSSGGEGSSSITLQDLGGASATDLTNHTSNTSNPHSVTYTQTGAAAASHTHVEADITDLGSYATNTDLNSYGVKSLSFDNSTGVLTLTMKDDSTKTVTIQVSGGSSSGGSGVGISSASYNSSINSIIFTMSDNSTVNCSLSALLNQVLAYESLDERQYNSEWEDRMTGSGTTVDPYLIYTPKDFVKINEDMTAHYKLMNNLDFAPVTGMTVEVSGSGYQIVTTDNTAPLYHNGEGFWPIGYNGYYPINSNSELSTSVWDISLASSNIVDGTKGSFTKDHYIFTGELDGNSKVIKGIACSPINTYAVALFSFLGNNTYIHNFTLKDSVFICNDVYCAGTETGIASIGAFITRYETAFAAVTISNVYNYATLINGRSTNSGNLYSSGICGPIETSSWSTYPVLIKECANHGEILFVDQNLDHKVSGIYNINANNSAQLVENCINYVDLYGRTVYGIGSFIKGVNINLGTSSINQGTSKSNIHAISSNSSSNPAIRSYANLTNWTTSYTNNMNDMSLYQTSKKVYFRTLAEFKTQEFVDEANALLASPAFKLNDLNVCNGLPLLIDEYNQYIGVNGNLNLSLIDPLENKVYKSGFSLQELQKVVTHREVSAEINQKFDNYVAEQFIGLKLLPFTITSSQWTAEEEDGGDGTMVPTGNYTKQLSVTGMTVSSPVQLMTQLSDLDIEISAVASNSVTLIANTQPQSDIRVAIMFVP